MRQISDAVKAALERRDGAEMVKFRYDVVRGGVKRREVQVLSCSLSLSNTDSIGRTARFVLADELDWLNDLIKPHMVIRTGQTSHEEYIYDLRTWDEWDALDLSWERRDLSWDGFERVVQSWDYWDSLNQTWDMLWDDTPTWDELEQRRLSNIVTTDQWEEVPLGLYMLSEVSTQIDSNGFVSYQANGYDRSMLLRQDCLTRPLYLSEGTKYLDAVQNVLVSAGIESVSIFDPTSVALPASREIEAGVSKLDLVNQLLTEINYDKIRCDADGDFVIRRYRQPSIDQVSWRYRADKTSIIKREMGKTIDYSSVPNVFYVDANNPDLDTPLHAEWINDDPDSIFSTVNRGARIVLRVDSPTMIASQQELDEYLARVAFERSQVFEEVSFTTALMPIHEFGEVIAINTPETSGAYQEQGYTMELIPGGTMTHQLRRLDFIG